MLKKTFLLPFIFIFLLSCDKKVEKESEKTPKLVVGIVIDQMRYDYLTRYYNRYGNGGFKRLLNEGFSLENAHFNYIPTYTAAGHASIYTGTTPDNHGIIGNWWYDKFSKKNTYCVDDDRYNSVGTDTNQGKKSPHRMFTTTVTDQLHLAQNNRGKTIGIAIKDRSAILPAGHTANGAYWYDNGKNDKFITSSFYMDDLPDWVKNFNKKNKAKDYLSKPWNTLYPIETYTNSLSDDNNFEGTFIGESSPTFPHNLPELMDKNGGFGLIKETPFGNTLTLDFTKAAILGENLGKSDDVDFLSVSFSSTDYVGHRYGVDAIETEDTYLRLDKDLEEFLNFLDKEVGKGNYTIFLTADHGVVRVPSYLKSLKMPANYFNRNDFKVFLDSITNKHFNSKELVEAISNYQIFLNKEKLDKLKLNRNEVAEKIADEVVNFKTIYKAVSAKTLQSGNFSSQILCDLQNGYNQKLSGDVMLIPSPYTLESRETGTSHGSGYSYDTHIPIIFYGNGIKKGVSKKRYEIIDIAPTIANFLKIEAPNSSTGIIIDEIFKDE